MNLTILRRITGVINLITVRYIAIGITLLAGVVLGVFVGDLRWEDTREGKSVQRVYAEFPDGSVQYGPYCTENGTKLEGGGICRVVEHTTAYTRDEAIFESILAGLFVGGVVALMGVGAIRLTFDRIAANRRMRRRLAL